MVGGQHGSGQCGGVGDVVTMGTSRIRYRASGAGQTPSIARPGKRPAPGCPVRVPGGGCDRTRVGVRGAIELVERHRWGSSGRRDRSVGAGPGAGTVGGAGDRWLRGGERGDGGSQAGERGAIPIHPPPDLHRPDRDRGRHRSRLPELPDAGSGCPLYRGTSLVGGGRGEAARLPRRAG